MKRTLPWQTPARNYYPLPKVLCQLGLSPGEIAVYSFLMYCENRTTYQCYPSYRTIGKAVGMSRNTVAKYVRQLEEKGLIRTERTTVTLKDGRRRNGSLLYTILPPEQAVEQFNRQQLAKTEAAPSVAAYKIRWPNRPQKPRLRPCEPLCDLAGAKAGEDSTPRAFERFRTDFRCAEIWAGERHWRFSAPMPFTAARSAGCHGGLRDFEIDADLGAPNMLWRYSLEKYPFAPCFQGFWAAQTYEKGGFFNGQQRKKPTLRVAVRRSVAGGRCIL